MTMFKYLMCIAFLATSWGKAQVEFFLDSQHPYSVGQGMTLHETYNLDELVIERNSQNGVTIRNISTEPAWSMSLSAPFDQELVIGDYQNLVPFYSDIQELPKIDFDFNHIGGGAYGWVNIYDIFWDGDELIRFAADLELYWFCETPRTRVSIRMATPQAISMDAPSVVQQSFIINSTEGYDGLNGGSVSGDQTTGHFDICNTFGNEVQIFLDEDIDPFLNAQFWIAEPNGSFEVGLFENAQSFPSQNTNRPSMNFSYGGAACSRAHGWFEVLELQFDPNGIISSFAIDFLQQCRSTPAVMGSIRHNSDIPLSPPPPLPMSFEFWLESDPDDPLGEGGSLDLDDSDGYLDVFVEEFSETFQFGDSNYHFTLCLKGPNNSPLLPGVFVDTLNADPASRIRPYLNLYLDNTTCELMVGSYEILELETDLDGRITTLAVNFVLRCDQGPGEIRATLRWNSSMAIDTNFIICPPVHSWPSPNSGSFDSLHNNQVDILDILFCN